MTSEWHQQVAERLEEYLLGGLTADERLQVEAHLRWCATCTAELKALSIVLEQFADTIPPVRPRPELRDRVLAAIDAAATRHARRGAAWWSTRAIAVAAGVLIAVLAGVLYVVDSSRRQLANDVRTADVASGTLRDRLQRYSRETDLALSILTAADMREIGLAGRENAAASAARAYWSPTRGLLVVADRLPTPPPGRIYQVWVIAGGQPLSAGLLGDQSAGRGMLIAPPPRANVGTTVTVAVTDEPPGGLPAPSGTIRLAGSI